VAAIAVAVCALTAPARALEVSVSAPIIISPGTAGADTTSADTTAGADTASADTAAGADTLVSAFRVHDVLGASDLTALGEGLPSTMSLVVDLWRVRDGWWDSLVRSQSFRYRFRRDLVRDVFVVQNPGRTMSTFTDRTALAAHLGREHEVVLAPPEAFPRGHRFYLSVKAVVEPLNLDDLEAIDAWLSGEVTTGRGGGVLGIPQVVLGLVVDLSGLGDRSAVGRSPEFTPNP
jgi:hypothetical protein